MSLQSLELKIPPPVVALLVALGMWFVARYTPAWEAPDLLRRALVVALAAVGAGFDIAGLVAFRRARTTINPMKPRSASALVGSGVYRVTRNPMYVGLALFLCAWAAYLWSPWALPGPVAFILYITRFQIAPEERALFALFGAEYSAYTAAVRRWL